MHISTQPTENPPHEDVIQYEEMIELGRALQVNDGWSEAYLYHLRQRKERE